MFFSTTNIESSRSSVEHNFTIRFKKIDKAFTANRSGASGVQRGYLCKIEHTIRIDNGIEVIVHGTAWYEGTSFCDSRDRWIPALGRKKALASALSSAFLQSFNISADLWRVLRENIWNDFFASGDGMKAKISANDVLSPIGKR